MKRMRGLILSGVGGPGCALTPRMDGVVEDSELTGRVVIEPEARVVRSVVRGPAIIGRVAVIGSAYVGPFTAVGDALP
jgi:glucose-1-phosphate thymidylyltransferase